MVGADTRAFRLSFSSGTAIFECADGMVYMKVVVVMKKVGVKFLKGCLYRCVLVDVIVIDVVYGDLEECLERAGYRLDVRSLWLV